MDPQPNLPPQQPQKPQVKVRGLDTGLTFKERLRQFKKKDLAFILAGLAVLFLAPLAEHFLLGPEETPGGPSWVSRGGTALWPGGAPGYEAGTGLAPGGAAGGAPELITPLNARDPSALVMGPGAAQQPPAGSGAPQVAAAPQPSEEELKNALAGAAARGVGTGVKQAVPHIALTGSGLRGLQAVTGGFNASAGSVPSSAHLVGGRPSLHGGLTNVRPVTGYRGAAGARGLTAGSSPDGLHKAAEAAAGYFNRAGSATAGLRSAAASAIPVGGTSFGGGHLGGGGYKFPGGGGPDKFSHSLGSLLAFDLAKKLQEGRIERQLKEEEENDPTLQLAKLRNKFLDTMAGEYAKTIVGITGDKTKGFLKGKPSNIGVKCAHWPGNPTDPANPGTDYPAGFIPASAISDVPKDLELKNGSATAFYFVNGNLYQGAIDTQHLFGTKCQPVNSDGSLGKAKKKDKGSGPGGETPGVAAPGNIENLCAQINTILEAPPTPGAGSALSDAAKSYLGDVEASASNVVSLRDDFYKTPGYVNLAACDKHKTASTAPICPAFKYNRPVIDVLVDIVRNVRGSGVSDMGSESSVIGTLQGVVNATKGTQAKTALQRVSAARKDLVDYKNQVEVLRGCEKNFPPPPDPGKEVLTGGISQDQVKSWKRSLAEAVAEIATKRLPNVEKAQQPVDEFLNKTPLLSCVAPENTLPGNCDSLGKNTGANSTLQKGALLYVIGTNNRFNAFAKELTHTVPSLETPSAANKQPDIAQVAKAIKDANYYFKSYQNGNRYAPKSGEPAQMAVANAVPKVQEMQKQLFSLLEDMRTNPTYPTPDSVKAAVATPSSN